MREYDKNFGDNKTCKCGHPYYRHFDTYEYMKPVGCKYCGCSSFELAEESVIDDDKDWEVLEIECYGGEIRKLIGGLYRIFENGIGFNLDYLLKNENAKPRIKSVKRLSDGCIFDVGDLIQWGKKWPTQDTTRKDEVLGFFIDIPKVYGEKEFDLYIKTKEVERLSFDCSVELKNISIKCDKVKSINPPLEIIPKRKWEEQRFAELKTAMIRYLDMDKEIPEEWIDEYNTWIKEYNTLTLKK